MTLPAPFLCLATRRLGTRLPHPEFALEEPPGLLAAGGTLEPEILVAAYRRGIFPWSSADEPLLWWAPDPRTVIEPATIHVSRSLRRSLRRQPWRITLDQAFERVIRQCAAPRRNDAGTWLSPRMIAAYCELFSQGHAHSLECWMGEELVGGIYGVASGAVFCGESMFSRVTDASKVALYALCRRLQHWGYALLDCQVDSPHLARMGARDLPRREFCALLEDTGLAARVAPHAWQGDPYAGKA